MTNNVIENIDSIINGDLKKYVLFDLSDSTSDMDQDYGQSPVLISLTLGKRECFIVSSKLSHPYDNKKFHRNNKILLVMYNKRTGYLSSAICRFKDFEIGTKTLSYKKMKDGLYNKYYSKEYVTKLRAFLFTNGN